MQHDNKKKKNQQQNQYTACLIYILNRYNVEFLGGSI